MILYKKFVLCLHIYKLFGKIFILLYSFKGLRNTKSIVYVAFATYNVNLGECYDF